VDAPHHDSQTGSLRFQLRQIADNPSSNLPSLSITRTSPGSADPIASRKHPRHGDSW
jgi:hypothetical protein